MKLYVPDKRHVKFGLVGLGLLLVFLAILIPAVTVRSAPPQTPDEQFSGRPYVRDSTFIPKPELLEVVHQALREVPLIDTHNDLPYQYYKLVGNHVDQLDLLSDLTGRTHTDIPRMRRGSMGGVFFAAYVPCASQYKDAVEFGFTQVDVINRFVDQYKEDLVMAYTANDISDAHGAGKIASLIGLEGGHMINSNLAMLRLYYKVGVRYMTLTHNCNTPWAESSKSDDLIPATKHDNGLLVAGFKGLTDFGKTVVREMNRLGMMVDISHVSHASMIDALATSKAPVIFSHSGAFAPCNHRRNAQDSILRKLKENGGVIMLNFWSQTVLCAGNYSDATIEHIVDQIKHIRQVAGIESVGLGADFDGVKDLPLGLEDVSTYPILLARLLEEPDWTVKDIKMLAGLNILRVMREVESVKADLSDEEPVDDTLDLKTFKASDHGANCTCRTLEDVTRGEDEEDNY